MAGIDQQDSRASVAREGAPRKGRPGGEPSRRADTGRGNIPTNPSRGQLGTRSGQQRSNNDFGRASNRRPTNGHDDRYEARSSRGYEGRSEKRDRFRADSSRQNNRKVWWYVGLPVLFVMVVGVIWLSTANGGSAAGGNAQPGDSLRKSAGTFTTVTPENGLVSLTAADFQDGKAHYYTYKAPSGKTIDFFVLKSSDGVIRAAIDACDVCFASRKGYHQEGDEMVCNNCGQRFPSTKINEVKGGCNPSPLTRTSSGDTVTIAEKDIVADGNQYF